MVVEFWACLWMECLLQFYFCHFYWRTEKGKEKESVGVAGRGVHRQGE